MATATLILALAALLFAPGPTNTLLAVAGAERGFRGGAARFVPVVLVACLAALLPLTLVGEALLARVPAALWVGWLAVRLWRARPAGGRARAVDLRQMPVTTLRNPKGLVIALSILPEAADRMTGMALIVAVLVASTLAWTALGAALGALSPGGGMSVLRQGSAVWLALVAIAPAAEAATG